MPVQRRQRRSRQQEQDAADRLDGRRVSGSGSGWITKNDVKTDDLSLEVKYTDKKSYSLKYQDLLKAEKNALLDGGREFAFLIGFGSSVGQGRMLIEREYVVLSREYYESLVSRGNPK